ncbi:hypothetical protein N7453_008625 [Penicillium expansum]|nr:hypothetical protein N7453_008625 [Penicillium expansum]
MFRWNRHSNIKSNASFAIREIRCQHEHKANNPNDQKSDWAAKMGSPRPSIPNREQNTPKPNNYARAVAATVEPRYDRFHTYLRATAWTDFEHDGASECLSAHRVCK